LGESITDGLEREITEETGLSVCTIMPVTTWSGLHDGQHIISITFVCWAKNCAVILSDEHEDFKWVSIEDLSHQTIDTDFDTTKWIHYINVAKYFEKELRVYSSKQPKPFVQMLK
jgi:ADP-ribose pyrophosphatase YjhB (NUDIX family)